MSTIPVLDLSFATYGVQVQIPAPHAEPPQLTIARQSPSLSWRLTTIDNNLVGYLGLYQIGGSKKLLLTVYGQNPLRIEKWITRPVPALDAAVSIEQLESCPDARVVIIGEAKTIPPVEPGSIQVRAVISLAGPAGGAPVIAGGKKGETQSPRNRVIAALREAVQAGAPTTSLPVSPLVKPVLDATPTAGPTILRNSRTAAGLLESDTARPSHGMLIPLEDVVARPISWLAPAYITAGKITIIAGEPGMGKSMLATDLAASVSFGRSWGGGSEPCLQGCVVIVSPEDDAHETTKPRLLAANASQEQIHILADHKGSIGIDELLEEVETLPNVRLLIIDPISAYLGGRDINRTGDVRNVLMPLAAWAEARGIAVVLVTHLNKTGSGQSPLSRVMGSQAFGAVARSVFLVCADPANSEHRLFLLMKDNIGASRQGLVFRIEPVTLPGGIRSARLVFNAEPSSLTAAHALKALHASAKQPSVLDETKVFLQHLLGAGEMSAEAVKAAASAHSISLASLRRGQQALGIKPRKSGMSEGWVWALPDDPGSMSSFDASH